MKFSLIIGTLNRPRAIKNCLESLETQTFQDYEIIIIDQSDDKVTKDLVKKVGDPRIIYKHVAYKGLSRARNDALRVASGEYFCLIDDDAYYDYKYLEIAREHIEEKTVLSGYIFDNITVGPFAGYKDDYNHKTLPMRMIIRTCPSAALVIPMSLVKEVGGFDEQLGVGSKYAACEETDLIVRGIAIGYQVKYVRELQLKHPFPIPETADKIDYIKGSSYYRGMGAFYKKHLDKHIKGLRICYIEVWLKLIIKRFLVFKYNKQDIDMLIDGLKDGLNNYVEVDNEG